MSRFKIYPDSRTRSYRAIDQYCRAVNRLADSGAYHSGTLDPWKTVNYYEKARGPHGYRHSAIHSRRQATADAIRELRKKMGR